MEIKKLSVFLFSFLFVFVSNSFADTQTIQEIGDYTQLALPAAAVAVSALKEDGAGVKQFAYATLLTMGVTYILKPTINETRPNGGEWSFPSGHTAIAFDSSTYLWRRYGPWYGVPATIVASFTGYSRVVSDYHYTHDVVAGAILGIGANLIFTSKYLSSVQVSATENDGVLLTYSHPL